MGEGVNGEIGERQKDSVLRGTLWIPSFRFFLPIHLSVHLPFGREQLFREGTNCGGGSWTPAR
jgi:hypothetical protein